MNFHDLMHNTPTGTVLNAEKCERKIYLKINGEKKTCRAEKQHENQSSTEVGFVM